MVAFFTRSTTRILVLYWCNYNIMEKLEFHFQSTVCLVASSEIRVIIDSKIENLSQKSLKGIQCVHRRSTDSHFECLWCDFTITLVKNIKYVYVYRQPIRTYVVLTLRVSFERILCHVFVIKKHLCGSAWPSQH